MSLTMELMEGGGRRGGEGVVEWMLVVGEDGVEIQDCGGWKWSSKMTGVRQFLLINILRCAKCWKTLANII